MFFLLEGKCSQVVFFEHVPQGNETDVIQNCLCSFRYTSVYTLSAIVIGTKLNYTFSYINKQGEVKAVLTIPF